MKQLLLAAPLMLAACAEPLIKDSDVIMMAPDPAYTYSASGAITPSSCQSGRASLYSGTASGCQRDLVFANQVLNPADLVHPVPPGPANAGPIGRAADRYLNGTPETTTGEEATRGGLLQ